MLSTSFNEASVAEPTTQFKIDHVRLSSFLRSDPTFAPFLENESCIMHIYQFKHGQSNPTYLLRFASNDNSMETTTFVLRKQPPGNLLKGAHQILREASILLYLHDYAPDVPVPDVYIVCPDASILGTPFYIMEHVQGVIYTDPKLDKLPPIQRNMVYTAMARVLAAIHAVDVLASPLGSNQQHHSGSINGFATHQVNIWKQQYEKSVLVSGDKIPEMEQLASWLAVNSPSTQRVTIVHGDFRMDNLIFDASNPSKILAVLDWELTSMGDPLADVTYCCLSHHLPPIGFLQQMTLLRYSKDQSLSNHDNKNEITSSMILTELPSGIPTEQGFVEKYSSSSIGNPLLHICIILFLKHRTISLHIEILFDKQPYPPTIINRPTGTLSVDINTKEWTFFLALGLFRAASISAGVYARSLAGNASRGKQAQSFQEIVPILSRKALSLISDRHQNDRITKSTPRNDHLLERINPVPPPSVVSSFVPSIQCQELLQKLRKFNDEVAIPTEQFLIHHYHHAEGKWPIRGEKWQIHPMLTHLSSEARNRGLWNLWIPEHTALALQADHPHWPWTSILPHQHGLSHTEYALLAIESGRCLYTPAAINCSAPDTGNMEILAKFGTLSQQERWLLPLLKGIIRSCFGMTEPGLSSSDPTQLKATATAVNIKRSHKYNIDRFGNDGDDNEDDEWEINGEKWWTTGANDPRCQVCIFVACTEPPDTEKQELKAGSEMGTGQGLGSGESDWSHPPPPPSPPLRSRPLPSSSSSSSLYRRHTLFLLPMNHPGVTVVRPLTVFGYDDAPYGHAYTKYQAVRVSSKEGILGGKKNLCRGFELAQSRLGPGRLHHCARLIGHGERAMEEVMIRGGQRQAFGKSLLDLGGNNERLAMCRIHLRLSQLTVMDAANHLDAHDRKSHDSSNHHNSNHHSANRDVTIHIPSVSPPARLSNDALESLAIAKVSVPRAIEECLDFAVQIHGGGGLSNDHPLAAFWAAARTLRLVDGPDEVHLRTLSKLQRRPSKLQRRPSHRTNDTKQKAHPGIGKSRL